MNPERSRRARRAGARMVLAGAVVGALACATAPSARAQVTVLGRPVAAMAVAPPSLGVSVTWAGALAIPAIQDGTFNDFSAPVSVTVTWSGMVTPTTLCAVGYFQNPAAALTSGSDVIPSNVVRGRVSGAGPTRPYTPFTQSGCTGGIGTNGGSLKLLDGVLSGSGSLAAQLELRLDLSGQSTMAAGTYVGTLNIRAVVQ